MKVFKLPMRNRILLFSRLLDKDKLIRFKFYNRAIRMNSNSPNKSIHSATIQEVHQIPLDAIIRPLIPILDEEKVKSLMETLKVSLG